MKWYAFSFEAYTTDTTRLSCEGHGSYMQLMADYYNTGRPMPDDDEQLADLVKLPIDRWLKVRKSLEPYFRIENGHWHHDRIEREMLEARTKHSVTVARAVAGGQAKWAKQKAKAAAASQVPPAKVPESSIDAQAVQQAVLAEVPEKFSRDAHLQLQLHPPSGGGEAPPPKAEPEGLGSQISPTFQPVAQARIDAIVAGFTIDDFEAEVRKFVATRTADGSFSNNWDASFTVWIEREKAHKAKLVAKPRAAPRIEVNTTTVDIDWDRQLGRWLKSQSLWSRKLCGPEPGQAGCRVPLDKLQDFNIDPATGLVQQKAATA